MSQRLTKEHENISPPLIPPIKGGKVPSPRVGEGLGEGHFRINTITLSEPILYFLPA